MAEVTDVVPNPPNAGAPAEDVRLPVAVEVVVPNPPNDKGAAETVVAVAAGAAAPVLPPKDSGATVPVGLAAPPEKLNADPAAAG